MKKLILVSVLFFSTLLLFGQSSVQNDLKPDDNSYCATDILQQKLLEQNPDLQKEIDIREAFYKDAIQASEKTLTPPYTLPVVVHIIHENGAENIPDAQVQQAIDWLNESFSNTGYYDQSTGLNTEIQFCLAIQDPDGNPTNGINRVQSPLTDIVMETNQVDMKNLSRWDPLSYINIWVIREICSQGIGCGVAGFAYFPSEHGSNLDGIVLESSFMGPAEGENAVLTHEMGHYLGLYHTFQGGCPNSDCLVDGDRVCDTPPDQTTARPACEVEVNSCTSDEDDNSINNPFRSIASGGIGDQLDMRNNYMDYSPLECYNAFSPGQTERMHWFLDNVRFSLSESIGCEDPCPLPLTVDFTPNMTPIVAGQAVTFINNTINGISYEWEIDEIFQSNTEDFSYTFNEEGEVFITLIATGMGGDCFRQLTLPFTVECGVQSEFSVDETTLNIGDEFTLTNLSQNADSYSWYVNTALMSNDENYSYTTTEAGVIEICLTAEDDFCEDTRCRYITVLDLGDGSFNGFHKWLGDSNRNGHFVIYHQGEDAFYAIGSFINSQNERLAQVNKLDKCGEVLWTKNYEEDAAFSSAEIAPNGDLVLAGQLGFGNSNNNVYLARMDAEGNLLWGKSLFRSGRQRAIKMKASINDPLGETYLVEHWKSNGSTSDDMAVFKFDAAGNVLWSKDYYGSADEQGRNIIPLTGGGVIVIGFASSISWDGLTIELDTNGNLMASKRYVLSFGFDMRAGIQMSDGGFIFVGGYFSADSNGGLRKPCIFRVDEDYNLVWVKTRVTSVYSAYSEIVRDIDGYLYTSSYDNFGNGIRYVVHKFDDAGNLIWARNVSGTVSSSTENAPTMKIAGTNPDRLITYQSELGPFGQTDNNLAVTDTSLMSCAMEAYEIELTEMPIIISDVSWTEELTSYTITNALAEEMFSNLDTEEICAGNCAEICNNGIDDDFDNLVDFYDPDCPCIDTIGCGTPFFNTCESLCSEEEIDNFNFAFEAQWTSPTPGIYDLNTTVVADIDGDCISDIVVVSESDDRLVVVNAETGNESYSIDLVSFPIDAYGTPALADVDLDGMAEIFILTRGTGFNHYLTRFDYDPNLGQLVQTWQNPNAFDFGLGNDRGTVPSIADFDGNGIPEIYILNKIYNSITGVLLADGGTNSIGGNTVDGGFGAAMTTAVDVLPNDECLNCLGLELVAGNQVYSVQINDYSDASANSIEVERTAPDNLRDGSTAIADFDMDGDLDAIVVFRVNSSVHHTIYVWDLQTETLIGNAVNSFPFGIGPGEPQVGLPAIGDIDGDNKPEIILLVRLRLVILEDYESGGGVNWGNSNAVVQDFTNITENSASTSFSLFDFNGDSKQEILHRGTETIDIYDENLNNLASQPCASLTATEYVTIVDAEQDGNAELYCSCEDEGLRKFVSSDNSWPATRAIWNQHNYYTTNILDDGTIPIEQQQQQLVTNSDGNYPLNNFLQQQPIYNEPAELQISLSVQDVGCGSDSTEVTFTLCNFGQNNLEAPIYVSFYDNNPTFTSADVIHLSTINESLLSGDCQNYTLSIPRTNEWIFAIANDNGTTTTPFDINNDFPNTGQVECDYIDNLDSLFYSYIPPVLDLGPDIIACDNGIVTLDAGADFVNYKWQDFSSEQIFTAWEDGTYWVTVIDECGGMQSDTIVIATEQITDLDLGADSIACGGESFVFELTYFDNWEWSPADFLDCSDCPTITASPDIETTYTVVAYTEEGCYSVDTVNLSIIPADVILSDTMEICPGESFDFYGVTISNEGDYEIGSGDNCDTLFNLFVFYPDTVLINETANSCTGESLDFYGNTITETGIYEFNSQMGCDTLFTLNALFSDVIETSAIVEICVGESAIIFGNEETAEGDYSEQNTSIAGCDSIHTITLNFFAPIEINTSTTETCAGQSTGASSVNIVANGQAPFQYLWIETNSTEQNQENLPAGIYTISITDDNGCSVQEEVTVNEISLPEISFETTDVSCFGDMDGSISFLTDAAVTVSLDGLNFSSTNVINNLSAGEYLLYFQNESDCIFTDSISINEPDELLLQVPEDTELALGDSIVLLIQTNGTDLNYQWQPPLYLNCDTCANPVATPFESLTYLLSATDTSDCIVEEEVTLFLNSQVDIYFPTAFSPNNDGVNDKFHPFAGTAVRQIKRLSIYDRWGELLYDNTSFPANTSSEGWDGIFRGKTMPIGVYVWVAEVEFVDGRMKDLNGDVLLMR